VTSFDEKIASLELYNKALTNVCESLYNRFDPHCIYAFNNEIHLVFFYNNKGDFIYNGNVTKTITTIASQASIYFMKELLLLGIDANSSFEGSSVEFDKQYETLNYLVWRQFDCKRNTITLLYKCLNKELLLDSALTLDDIKLECLEKEVYAKSNCANLLPLVHGNLIKKKLVKQLKRKQFVNEHVVLWENFAENLQKYIVSKLLSCD
jgi:hypothetical protein